MWLNWFLKVGIDFFFWSNWKLARQWMKGGSYFKVGSPPAHKYCGKAGERERKKNATANIESGEHLLRLTECSAGELIAFHSVALQQLTRLMKNAWSKIIPLFEPLTLGGRRKKTGGGGGGGWWWRRFFWWKFTVSPLVDGVLSLIGGYNGAMGVCWSHLPFQLDKFWRLPSRFCPIPARDFSLINFSD